MREFTINENDAGQRLDKFITKLMPNLPRSLMYKGFRKNCVKLNRKHVKDGAKFLKSDDIVTLYFKDEFFEDKSDFNYTAPSFDAVYEDSNIIIVNKPAGLLSHADSDGGGVTLIDMIQSYLYDKNEYIPHHEQTFRPALCNRLDRNTSGLVIAAKNASALREMNKNIKDRNVHKFYTALAEGQVPDKGKIKSSLSRSGMKTYSDESGKSAMLSYRLILYKDGYSLVHIELYTGRTHQIRVQFSDMGHPLAGDKKYGGKPCKFKNSLCCTELKFDFNPNSSLSYLNSLSVKITAPFEKYF